MKKEKVRRYNGIYIPHRVIDADSKEIAQKSFSGWQHAELTAEQWIEKTHPRSDHSTLNFHTKERRHIHTQSRKLDRNLHRLRRWR